MLQKLVANIFLLK